jgi:hypothetical protein
VSISFNYMYCTDLIEPSVYRPQMVVVVFRGAL